MPWMETRAMDERMKFLMDHKADREPLAELCRRYGISRKTGYKWITRHEQEGAAGLTDRSRAPHAHSNRVPEQIVQAIVRLRAESSMRYGPKKIRVRLQEEFPHEHLPAHSTIAAILDSHGLIVPRKKRRRVPAQSHPLAECQQANSVWCIDFKGWFLTGDGRRCDPLTITDGFSRYLLCCQALTSADERAVRPIMEVTFRQYGLPQAIRSDNGAPFASRAVGGLSRLSIWWIKLGIRVDRIQPGKPQQNGRHERMHLTLKNATADPPASTWGKQQERFKDFRREYNESRPHEALGMKTPASMYDLSPRPYPTSIPDVVYADDWLLRRVQCDGDFYWRHQPVFLTEVLHGETIGLEPVDGRYWRAHFGPVFLGVFDSHARRMLTAAQAGRTRRRGLTMCYPCAWNKVLPMFPVADPYAPFGARSGGGSQRLCPREPASSVPCNDATVSVFV